MFPKINPAFFHISTKPQWDKHEQTIYQRLTNQVGPINNIHLCNRPCRCSRTCNVSTTPWFHWKMTQETVGSVVVWYPFSTRTFFWTTQVFGVSFSCFLGGGQQKWIWPHDKWSRCPRIRGSSANPFLLGGTMIVLGRVRIVSICIRIYTYI